MNKYKELEEILRDLIAFKTISHGSTTQIMEYLAGFSKNLGFKTSFISDINNSHQQNLLCHIGPKVPHGLMLCGHVDVVPVQGQDWLFDPFSLTKKDDKLIGRGVADMKGFIAATYFALANFSLSKIKKPLSLLWTYDEEVGCLGSKMAIGVLKDFLLVLPSWSIIGEPTDFNIFSKHKGHTEVLLRVKGKGAHSSLPGLGISAIKTLNKALTAIFSLEKELNLVCLNVGKIEGGTAINIIPDEAKALVGFRALPNMKMEDIFLKIKEEIFKATKDEDAKISLEIINDIPSMSPKKDHKNFLKILKPFANSSIEPLAPFATDGGNLSLLGIECLIFGPGSIAVAHQANEWVFAKDLELYAQKLTQILNEALF